MNMAFDFDESAYWQEPDFLLADLVNMLVNMAGVELGVTLLVKGTMMTGTLVGEREYLQLMTEVFSRRTRQVFPDMDEEDLKLVDEIFDFTRLTESQYPPLAEIAAEELERASENGSSPEEEEDGERDDYDLLPVRYLHLKNPIVISPQPIMGFGHSELPIMRIRLSQVDGWLLGRALTISDDEGGSGEVLH